MVFVAFACDDYFYLFIFFPRLKARQTDGRDLDPQLSDERKDEEKCIVYY